MKVCIVGGGNVGYHIASILSEEGHDITIIEKNPERSNFIQGKVDAMVITGSGSSEKTLKAAKISTAEWFIAVTGDDTVNFIACLLAKEHEVPHKIARIKDVEYSKTIEKVTGKAIGIDFLIKTRNVVAHEITNMVQYFNTTEAAEFAKGEVVFFSVPHQTAPDVSLENLSIQDIRKKYYKLDFSIVAITRKGKMLVPHQEEIIESGDIISFMCKANDFNIIQKELGLDVNKANNIFILGCGVLGREVAKRLLEKKYTVKIADRNAKQCEVISNLLPDALVINTTSTDVETLTNEGVDEADVFIAMTDDDQANILGSLLAKKSGAKRAITIVNDPELVGLTSSLGINICINPRLSTASAILKYLRGKNVFSVTMLEENDTEIIEFQLPKESDIFGKPLHSIDIPDGIRIGAIVRKSTIIMPTKDSELKPKDHIVALCLVDVVAQAEKFFS